MLLDEKHRNLLWLRYRRRKNWPPPQKKKRKWRLYVGNKIKNWPNPAAPWTISTRKCSWHDFLEQWWTNTQQYFVFRSWRRYDNNSVAISGNNSWWGLLTRFAFSSKHYDVKEDKKKNMNQQTEIIGLSCITLSTRCLQKLYSEI